ncbi:3-hydroxyacyl-CoA dehydrogenase/enoyl-CoA hydratase family protein [Rhizosphaericola mali]|uniref:3-hydroxyacyl-CoA dehydrogenase/enoyl-CoA hydratase family protein n=1 Tax=Rhizosphaericola mali TaxID=2545455 RepID=A0A5P2G3U7_9BACT|nr:3-hydroxyacyl-CoA dehydrogenase/enoyl-CoA hydratase family protein [Rhizosphaericola mali]QES89408.1 3-hydroxyacyl-CoA dehydrogenase/enoyl-CoA hydratase family protein [Rhizosphaericola mali]
MKRIIKKVAVLGSGIMGSRIACHFANIGIQVLLLDIVPKEPNEKEAAKGLTLESKVVRNRIVNDALQTALKSNPSPIYKKEFANRIATGNFDDDMKKIAECDWVIEVVVENLNIKKSVYEKVEQYRKAGTLITSNTSGIPIHLLEEGRSEDFKKNFCGTHFFNPPRYLRLLEIIPAPATDPSIVEYLTEFGQKFLGKTTVICKDTPAFIANRVGVFGIMDIAHIVKKLDLTVEEVDKLTGPVIGHAKSATFRTSDVVGLDTMVHVANGVYDNCPNDEVRDLFKLPDYVAKMYENKWLGDKTGQGFYKKTKDANGKTQILALDLNTFEYQPSQKVKFATLEATKTISDLKPRFKVLVAGKDKAADFYRLSFAGLFAYVSNRIPEIADELYKIDDAIETGFGWELGPFKTWDAIGVKEGLEILQKEGKTAAPWVEEMLAAGNTTFYKSEDGKSQYYDIPTKSYKVIPGTEDLISLDNLRATNTIYSNPGLSIIDIGDGILNVEFHSKMNTIGGDILMGIQKAIDIAEKSYRGVVISNNGANFSAGANVAMIFMMAIEQDYDELDMTINLFQQTTMRIRYSSIPVVVAPHNLTLGGGCEICLHADKVVAHAEAYIGLVEFGVGLIPGGGGTKEFALRAGDHHKDGDIDLNIFRDRFLTIGQAKVSTSAYEAFELGYLRPGIDEVVVSRERLLTEAKAACLRLADEGYVKPTPRTDIRVLGNQALGVVYIGANSMKSGNYISEHDQKISEKLGFAMAGGDISQPTLVSEQYLLDLERKAFLELTAEKKSLERIQSILNGGKILRN